MHRLARGMARHQNARLAVRAHASSAARVTAKAALIVAAENAADKNAVESISFVD